MSISWNSFFIQFTTYVKSYITWYIVIKTRENFRYKFTVFMNLWCIPGKNYLPGLRPRFEPCTSINVVTFLNNNSCFFIGHAVLSPKILVLVITNFVHSFTLFMQPYSGGNILKWATKISSFISIDKVIILTVDWTRTQNESEVLCIIMKYQEVLSVIFFS
jgi:hypothetical protein